MQNDNQVITPQTQEITVGFNPVSLTAAAETLTKNATTVEVNLSVKNWDTNKVKAFERAVFLGCDMMPAMDKPTGEIKTLECAFFMDNERNIWYKAAYQFIKAVKFLPINANFSVEYMGRESIKNGNQAETFKVKMLVLGDATA